METEWRNGPDRDAETRRRDEAREEAEISARLWTEAVPSAARNRTPDGRESGREDGG